MNATGSALTHWRTAWHLIGDRAVLAAYGGTLLLSALLLFSVQPIFAKMVLPKLGGSPSVWAISMCFFQGVLLLGYCYAHAINRWVPPAWAPVAHVLLLAAAYMALPFGLPAGAEPPAGDAYLWLIGLLAAGVGLPFFAVSASAPLLQAWFARTGHPHAADPYFLYGASNLGSLSALLAYPVLIEPFLGLSMQARVWTAGFLLLVALIAAAGSIMLATGKPKGEAANAAVPAADAAPLTWSDRLAWTGLAAIPSGLLVAYTSYVTTDVASAPFIWVLPLAVFLATFILVFRERPALSSQAMARMQPFAIAVTFTGLAIFGSNGWLAAMAGGFAAFFLTTMIAHRVLYERRPHPTQLTEFYLWMSLGGVLGGVFPAIVAPQVFSSVAELPLLLTLGLLCRPGIHAALADTALRRQTLRALAIRLAAIVLPGLVIWYGFPGLRSIGTIGLVVILGFAAKMILSSERPLAQTMHGICAGVALLALPTAMNMGEAERSFFGVHRIVHETVAGEHGSAAVETRQLVHGTTTHGLELLTDLTGKPVTGHPTPASYYHVGSPIARALELSRKTAAQHAPHGFKVGIVGLGAGTVACYARAGDHWRFFEIDPVVAQLARRRFSFLPKCLPDAEIVLGDARLTLAKETGAKFDYLLIDAFSSDAIPVHLITREAMQLYVSKLADDGILALHISNRHVELETVVAALAASIEGLHAAVVANVPSDIRFTYPSHVMLVTKSKAALQPALAWSDARPAPATTTAVWTDDFSDILSAIWRRYAGVR